MELQLVTKDIYNEGDYYFLEEDMNDRCNELLEEKNLPLVTFKLGYNLSYSQGSGVWFREFNISFNELIKYLLEVKTLTQIEYDILYSAHEEGLYDFNYILGNRNRIYVNTSINDINNFDHISKTYSLLKQYKSDEEVLDDEGNIYFTWDTLSNILSEHGIELALKDLMDSICYDLKEYGYEYIESEDEYECKNILFDKFMELNNIETNIEYHEGGEYLYTKQQIENLNQSIEDYTLINNNNLNDYYIKNDLINMIEEKERVVKFYQLTI